MSPRTTISSQKRIERAQQMLAQTDLSLAEIAYAVGFSDQSHLARHFRRVARDYASRVSAVATLGHNEDLQGRRAMPRARQDRLIVTY